MSKLSSIVVASLQRRAAELAARLDELTQRKTAHATTFTDEEKDGACYGYFLDLDGDICEARARLSIYRNADLYTPESLETLRRYYEHRRDISRETIDAFDGIDGAAEFRRVKENFVVQETERALFMLDGLDKMRDAVLDVEGLKYLADDSVKE